MIQGIGVDLVELARIDKVWQSQGEAFTKRILATSEQAEFVQVTPKQQARFLAKRWAAKEAFAKACGTGVREPVTWQHLWVTHDALGKPSIAVDETLRSWLHSQQLTRWHLSLSDTDTLITAFVTIENHEP
jgi:holo-[acyl-carrier protein] synthase